MIDVVSEPPARKSTAWIWAAAFVIGMFGAGIFARAIDLNEYWSMAIMIPPMLLLIPLVKSAQKSQAACGNVSPAILAYNRRMLIWSFAYVIALFGAISIYKQLEPSGPVLWLIAVLPSLPILYFVWALGRYLVEETDEYIRMTQVSSALFATGWLLVLATIWGFLETFGVAAHVPSWAAVPLWAIGLGVGQIWRKTRGSTT
jgi:hypothetical protein